METGHPLTRAVNSGSGNRALGVGQLLNELLLFAVFSQVLFDNMANVTDMDVDDVNIYYISGREVG